jgi:hypothetical protein
MFDLPPKPFVTVLQLLHSKSDFEMHRHATLSTDRANLTIAHQIGAQRAPLDFLFQCFADDIHFPQYPRHFLNCFNA